MVFNDDFGRKRVNRPSIDLREAKTCIELLKRKLKAVTVERDQWKAIAEQLTKEEGSDEQSL